VGGNEELRNMYKIFVGKPEEKRPLGNSRYRWEDNIRMDLKAVGYEDMDWIYLVQDSVQWQAFVNMIMNLPANGPKDGRGW